MRFSRNYHSIKGGGAEPERGYRSVCVMTEKEMHNLRLLKRYSSLQLSEAVTILKPFTSDSVDKIWYNLYTLVCDKHASAETVTDAVSVHEFRYSTGKSCRGCIYEETCAERSALKQMLHYYIPEVKK